MKGKLRHVTLAVTDMEKTAKFYEDPFEFSRLLKKSVAKRISS